MKKRNDAPSSTERWKLLQYIKSDGTIETYSNYMISDQGRVASLVDNHGSKRPVMKILKQFSTHKGYLQVSIRYSNKRYTRRAHQLVISSFCPEGWFRGCEIDHIDRDRSNNHLENLRWISRDDNNANRGPNPMKPVKVTYLNDGHIELYDNMVDCSRAFGKNLSWCGNIICKYKGYHRTYNILIEKLS